MASYWKEWGNTNAVRCRAGKLKREFGMTLGDYDDMVTTQGGRCAICKEPCPTGNRLAVDHDHDSGVVRGLLCMKCNTGLGHFDDSPRKLTEALAYLGQHESAD